MSQLVDLAGLGLAAGGAGAGLNALFLTGGSLGLSPLAPSMLQLVDLAGLLLAADGAGAGLNALLGAGGLLGHSPVAPGVLGLVDIAGLSCAALGAGTLLLANVVAVGSLGLLPLAPGVVTDHSQGGGASRQGDSDTAVDDAVLSILGGVDNHGAVGGGSGDLVFAGLDVIGNLHGNGELVLGHIHAGGISNIALADVSGNAGDGGDGQAGLGGDLHLVVGEHTLNSDSQGDLVASLDGLGLGNRCGCRASRKSDGGEAGHNQHCNEQNTEQFFHSNLHTPCK